VVASLTLYSCILKLIDFDPTMYWERLQGTGFYHQAVQWNIKANKAKMKALGLEASSPKKTRLKPSRQKTRHQPTKQKTRHQPTRQSTQQQLSGSTSEYGKLDDESDNELDDGSDGESDDGSDDADPTLRWSRCPRHHKALEPDQEGRLSTAFSNLVKNGRSLQQFGDYHDGKYYCFVQRVCKAYAYLWGQDKNPKDALHMNKENIVQAAVAAVYDQIQPPIDKPHSGTI